MPLPLARPRRPATRRLAPLLVVALAACDKPIAVGAINNVMVAASTPVWEALAGSVEQNLTPRSFTVRDERIFEVSQVDPTAPEWGRLRNVRQILAIGEPADPWIAEALEEVEGPTPTPPAVFEVRNVWAQNQRVTVVLVPPASRPAAAEPQLAEVGALLVRRLEEYARGRMYVSGVDSTLADSLSGDGGFSLLLPDLYRGREIVPGAYEFRNDNPDPATLIRAIEVDSRPSAEVEATPEAVLRWRADIAARATDPPQVTDPAMAESRRVEVNGRSALQVQGVWSNPPGEWPAAGPFLTRLVDCGARTFLVDGWLYAPGRAKYEYMVQLQTILDTFRCN